MKTGNEHGTGHVLADDLATRTVEFATLVGDHAGVSRVALGLTTIALSSTIDCYPRQMK